MVNRVPQKKESLKSPDVMGYSYEEMLEMALSRIPENVKKPVVVEMVEFNVIKESDRTIITNWNTVINRFNIDEKLLLKFLQRRLGTIGMIQKGKLYLQGVYTKVRLNRLLDAFIREYIICDVCGRPHCIVTKERGSLIKKCQACGAWRAVERP